MKRIFIIILIFLTSQSYSQYNSEKISDKNSGEFYENKNEKEEKEVFHRY